MHMFMYGMYCSIKLIKHVLVSETHLRHHVYNNFLIQISPEHVETVVFNIDPDNKNNS